MDTVRNKTGIAQASFIAGALLIAAVAGAQLPKTPAKHDTTKAHVVAKAPAATAKTPAAVAIAKTSADSAKKAHRKHKRVTGAKKG